MRTTLTLEADVAALLKRVMREQDRTLKEAVNDALRTGLTTMATAAVLPLYRVRPFNLGPSLVGSLDNIEEVLSRAEGEDHG